MTPLLLPLLLMTATSADAATLTADQAVALALDSSHVVAAAEAGRDSAVADARGATLGLFPKLSGAAGYTRLDQVPYVEFDTTAFTGSGGDTSACDNIDPTTLPDGFTLELAQGLCELITGWMTPDLGDAGASRIEMGLQDNYFATLTVEQVVFAGGALIRARQASQRMLDASGQQVRGARAEVAYSAVEAFYGLFMAREGAEVAREALGTLDAVVVDLQNMVDVGMASRADLLTAQARQSQARLDVLRATHGAALAETMFRTTVGLPKGEPVELVLEEPRVVAQLDRDDMVASALTHRPDVAAMDSTLRAMDHYTAATWASWLPAVVVRGNLNWKNPNYALEPEWYQSADITIAAQWSFWDRGLALTSHASTVAKKRQLFEQRSSLADYMAIEVELALSSLQEAQSEVEVAEVGLAQAEEALRLQQDRFAQGMANTTELLTAQSALAGAKVNHLQARTRVPLARAALDKAVGIDPEGSR